MVVTAFGSMFIDCRIRQTVWGEPVISPLPCHPFYFALLDFDSSSLAPHLLVISGTEDCLTVALGVGCMSLFLSVIVISFFDLFW